MNQLITAHNGYLETYLNGGLIGVALLVFLLLSMGRSAVDKLLDGGPLGKISFVFWVIALVHNISESGFFLGTPLWITLLLVTIDLRGPRYESKRLGSPKGPNAVIA